MTPNIFFHFNIFILFFWYETIEIHARRFLTLIILTIGSVGQVIRSSGDAVVRPNGADVRFDPEKNGNCEKREF